MKVNNKVLPNTNITLKQFKEMLYDKFKAYPSMYTDYKDNVFIITNTYYEKISITQRKLSLFCNKLGIKYKKDVNCIIIQLLAK
jgi:hypothetical protein